MIDLKIYDLLQDRSNDENDSFGVWDLSFEIVQILADKFNFDAYAGKQRDELWEQIYNFLQDFKETIITDVRKKDKLKLRKQERQKVIAEFEECVEKASNNYISKFDTGGQYALFLVKQKLNEMKGESL